MTGLEDIRVPPTPFSGESVDGVVSVKVDVPLVGFSPIQQVSDASLIGESELSNSPPETPDVCLAWEADSDTLLADAHNVRRLLRLSFRSLLCLVSKADNILDALFVAEEEIEVKVQLSVFVNWMVLCETQSRLRAVASHVKECVHRENMKLHFKLLYREWRIKVKLVWREDRRVERTRCQVLLEWNRVVTDYARPAKSLEKLHSRNLTFSLMNEWRMMRTQRHLSRIHAVSRLESFRVSQAMVCLRENLERRRKKRRAERYCKRSLLEKYVSEWTNEVFLSKQLYEKIRSIKSGPYLVYKLGVNLPVARLHVPKFIASERDINISVSIVAFRKWRNYGVEAAREKQICERDFLSLAFSKWHQSVVERKTLLRSATKLKLWQARTGEVKIVEKYMCQWKDRKQRRDSLRAHCEKTTFWLITRVLCGWRFVVESERRLELARKGLEGGILASKFLAIKILQENSAREKTLSAISSLFLKKWYGRLLVNAFKRIISCREETREIEEKGDWLCLRIRFDRWSCASRERARLKSAVSQISLRCAERWLYAWTCELRQKRFNRERENGRRTIVFQIFEMNLSVEKKKRIDDVLVNEMVKKSMFKRMVRFGRNKTQIERFHNKRMKEEIWVHWVNFMGISDILNSLEIFRQFFIQRSLLDKLRLHAIRQRDEEEEKTSQILRWKKTNLIEEWRVLSVFIILKRHRENKQDDLHNRKLKLWSLAVWKEEFSLIEKLAQLANKRRKNHLKSILLNRVSPWRLSVLESKLTRRVDEANAAACLAVWMFGLAEQRRIKSELIEKYEIIQNKKIHLILLNWKFFVSNRQRHLWAMLVEWRAFATSARRQFALLVWFIPEVESRKKKNLFSIWQNRSEQRSGLRQRVGLFSANYENRLLAASFLGFFFQAEFRRKSQYLCSLEGNRKRMGKFIDKWVHATVLAISLREIFARIVVIVEKVRCVYAFGQLVNHCKFEIHVQEKLNRIDSLNLGKEQQFTRLLLGQWACIVHGKKKEILFQKKIFFSRIKNFFISQTTNRSLKHAAEDWAVVQESSRMAVLIADLLIQWKNFTEYSMEIDVKFSALKTLNNESRIAVFFAQWKYAAEVAMYESDLHLHMEALESRLENKVKSNIFTYFVILFRESQGLAKFSDEYSNSSLIKRALLGWGRIADLSKREKKMERLLDGKRLTNAFKFHLCRELQLLGKENAFFRIHSGKEVFRRLRSRLVTRRKKLIAKSIGKWRSETDKNFLSAEMHLKSVVFASWKVVQNEAKLVRIYLRSERPDSYRNMRGKSVHSTSPLSTATSTPLVQPVVVASSSSLASYKQLRSLIS